jgi:hypothetical protein
VPLYRQPTAPVCLLLIALLIVLPQQRCDAAEARASLDFTHADFKPATVAHHVNGNPVFIRELYSLRRPEDFRIARFLGFNAAIGNGKKTLELAESADFFVTEASWWGIGTKVDSVLSEAAVCDGRPRLISMNLHDEPDLRIHYAAPEHLRPFAKAIKAKYPDIKLSATLAGSGRALSTWKAYAADLDIMRVDPYPLVSGKPLSHVRDLIVAGQQAAEPELPVICILQGWSWAGGPLPSAQQTRQMIWQSLIAGAVGLSYYDWNLAVWTKQSGFVAEIAAANALIADDLEPFLVAGQRSQTIESEDAYGRMWRMSDGSWRLLLTRLGNAHAETSVKVDVVLPDDAAAGRLVISESPGTMRPLAADNGRFSVELPPLASVLIASQSLRRDGGTIWRPNAPVPDGESAWRCDLAGRPLSRLPVRRSSEARPKVDPLVPILTASSVDAPFVAAGMTIHIDSATSGHNVIDQAAGVSAAFQGGRFRSRVTVDPGRATHLWLEPVEWTLPGGTPAPDLARNVSIRRGPISGTARDRSVSFRVDVPVANDRDLSAERDHLLALRLHFRHAGVAHHTTRVLRWRLKPCADIDWQWTGDDRAVLAASPSFPRSCYSPTWAKQIWRFDGAPLRIEDTSSSSRTVRFTSSQSGERMPLSFNLGTADGRPLISQTLTHITVRNDRIIAPHAAKSVVAAPWEGPWPTSAKTAWKATERGSGLRDFVHFGSTAFTDEDHQAWLFYDAAHLYWLMQSEAKGRLRAETTDRDQSFLGDDCMMLFLGDTEDNVFRIMINPSGVTHDMKMKPSRDKSWNTTLDVLTDSTTKHWRIAARIPWRDVLGADFTPTPGTVIRLNLVTGRSIAPRVMSSWHPWQPPYDTDRTLGTVTLGGAAK